MMVNDLKSMWEQIRHDMHTKWSRVEEEGINLDQVFNQKDDLIDMLQEEYGLSKEAAEEEVKSFETSWRNRTLN